MTIKYDYLEDGTPYVAAALNDRIEPLAQQVNSLTLDNLAEGGLRTEHLPSPVGIRGKDAGEDKLTSFVEVTHKNHRSTNTYNEGDFLTSPIVWFKQPIDMSTGSQDQVEALVVLANIHVHKFLRHDGTNLTQPYDHGPVGLAAGHYAWEDGYIARFDLHVVFADMTTEVIPWANRSISPGLVVGGLNHWYSNQAPYRGMSYVDGSGTFIGDDMSYKDVALRAVITKEDYANLSLRPIRGLKIRLGTVKHYPATQSKTGGASGTGPVVIGKSVLSAIPIQCGVDE